MPTTLRAETATIAVGFELDRDSRARSGNINTSSLLEPTMAAPGPTTSPPPLIPPAGSDPEPMSMLRTAPEGSDSVCIRLSWVSTTTSVGV